MSSGNVQVWSRPGVDVQKLESSLLHEKNYSDGRVDFFIVSESERGKLQCYLVFDFYTFHNLELKNVQKVIIYINANNIVTNGITC